MRRRAPPALAALVVGALVVGATALLAACGGGGGDGDGDLAGLDAVALLREAADRTEQVQSFRFVLEHEHGATEIVRGLLMERAEGEVAGVDRLRVEIEASLGPLNLEVGVVVIGEDGWITNPLTGRWEREDITVEDVFDPATGVTALMRVVDAARVTGTDRVGGVRSYRVEATVDSGDVTLFGDPSPGRALAATVWIGIDDALVRRIEIVGGITADEPDNLLRRVTLRDFDAEIEIVPPR